MVISSDLGELPVQIGPVVYFLVNKPDTPVRHSTHSAIFNVTSESDEPYSFAGFYFLFLKKNKIKNNKKEVVSVDCTQQRYASLFVAGGERDV